MKETILERMNRMKKKVRNAMRYRMRQAVNFALADEKIDNEPMKGEIITSDHDKKDSKFIICDVEEKKEKKNVKKYFYILLGIFSIIKLKKYFLYKSFYKKFYRAIAPLDTVLIY